MKNKILFILTGLLLAGCDDSNEPKDNDWQPVNNNCDYIDLGLPSGNLWAYANVGAPVSPSMWDGWLEQEIAEMTGKRYAWGELSHKDVFKPEEYHFINSSSGKMIDWIDSNICNTSFDTASQLWGGDWQMPTRDDFEELLEYCTFDCDLYTHYAMLLVRGPNGNCIFIWLRECETGDRRFITQLWSGESVEDESLYAYALEIDETGARITTDIPKYEGCYVRPVMKPKK